MPSSATIVQDLAGLERLIEPWDALAGVAQLPTCTGTWMVAWARAHGVRPLVAVARDGDDVIGIVPLVHRPGARGTTELHLFAAAIGAGSAPLAAPGAELDVAELASGALAAHTRADCVVLEGLPAEQPWPQLLATRWPGAMGRFLQRENVVAEPLVACLPPTFDGWLERRSPRFRQQLRRNRRRLESLGIGLRVTATADELSRDLDALAQLHRLRWDDRGGSGVMTREVQAMLAQAGPPLLAAGALQLLSLEDADGIVASYLWLNAGGHHTGWLGGFDPRLAGEPLDFVGMAAGIEQAFAGGATRISLGPGGREYKRRLTDSESTLATWRLPLRARGAALMLARSGATAARRELARGRQTAQALARRNA